MMTWMTRGLGAATVALTAVVVPAPAHAAIEPCPDVEVVFARGTANRPAWAGWGSRSSTPSLRNSAAATSRRMR